MDTDTKPAFPAERLAKMAELSRAFKRDSWDGAAVRRDALRLDGLSDEARNLLAAFNPLAAMQIELGKVSRVDAGESLWFARQLEYIRPGLLEVRYPELKGKQIVPVNNTVDPGSESYTYRSTDMFGEVLVTSDYSRQTPRSDVKGGEATQVIRALTTSYGYNMQEMRAAIKAGLPLDVRKAMAARSNMERKLDDVIFFGDAASSLKGFANLSSGTTSYTVANGNASGNQLWRTKSADEIAADMHGLVAKIVSVSLEIFQPDTLVVPLRGYAIISTRRMAQGSNQTILDYFLSTNPYVKNVVPTHKLDYANRAKWSGSSGRMVALRSDPMVLEAVIPQEFEQLPPQMEGFETLTLCHARTAGVVAYYPPAIAYGDGITDSSD